MSDCNQFLAQNSWGEATQKHLAGDASNRSYLRLHRDTGETAVLMDAPPTSGEAIRPFVAITDHLRGLGLSAPRILAQDEHNGFLLIEDLGDALFARLIRDNPDQEHALYSAAVDVAARSEGKRRLATTPEGERVISNTTVFTVSVVGYDDLIDSRRILEILNMVDGVVKWFDSRKGYGFITYDDETDVFVHFSVIQAEEGTFKTLYEGDKVTFEITEGEKGPQAIDVVVTEKAPRSYRGGGGGDDY